MAKFELTKSIEAVKLNPRTLRPLSDLKHTIPYGAVLEKLDPRPRHPTIPLSRRALRVPRSRHQVRPPRTPIG